MMVIGILLMEVMKSWSMVEQWEKPHRRRMVIDIRMTRLAEVMMG